jgi:glucan phosphoethanolaminetransferase (alkaline phosphatase superfamily)
MVDEPYHLTLFTFTHSSVRILYIALSIMIVEAMVTLVILLVKLATHLVSRLNGRHIDVMVSKDEEQEEDIHPMHLVPNWMTFGGLAFSVVLCAVIVSPMFSIPFWASLVALLFACFISILGVSQVNSPTNLNVKCGVTRLGH